MGINEIFFSLGYLQFCAKNCGRVPPSQRARRFACLPRGRGVVLSAKKNGNSISCIGSAGTPYVAPNAWSHFLTWIADEITLLTNAQSVGPPSVLAFRHVYSNWIAPVLAMCLIGILL